MTGRALEYLGACALVLVLLFCSPQHACARGPLPPGFVWNSLEFDGEQRDFVVYVPHAYRKDKQWPVVLFLHGAGEKGVDGVKPISVGLGVALAENADAPFIAVFPQCQNVRGRHLASWLSNTSDAKFALAALAKVEASYSIDPGNQTLCGWSMGGYGAWGLATVAPEKWARVMAISGGETEEPLNLHALAKSQTTVWAIHGKEDQLVPSSKTTDLVDRLKALEGNVKSTIVVGAGHDIWRDIFADSQVLKWLAGSRSTPPQTIPQLDQLARLPGRSPFYLENYTQTEVLSNMISLRLGNDAFDAISQGLPEAVPATTLQGKLDDIQREFSSGESKIRASLSDIRFASNVVRSELKALSGGRFRTRFSMSPLRLSIGATEIQSGQTTATSGPFHIDIGHLKPVVLEIELQPTASVDGFKLIPLRQRFSISDNNWHITPPTEVSVSNDRYTKANVVTGIVGGLYLQREEIEQAVLGVVPTLLKIVENELNSRQTPRLAKLLWPFPALVPDLSIAPAEVRTDSNGVSLVFDMQVRATKPADAQQPDNVDGNFHVQQMLPHNQLDFAISLSAINQLGKYAIRDGLAYINLQDLPERQLSTLTSPEVLREIFPDSVGENSSSAQFDVGLELIEPFEIETTQTSSVSSNPTVAFNIPHARLTVLNKSTRQLDSVDFSLTQQLRIRTEGNHGVIEALIIDWLPNPAIQVIATTSSSKTSPQKFIAYFESAWANWSASQSGIARSIPRMEYGSASLVLEAFSLTNGIAELKFRRSNARSTESVTTNVSSGD